MRRLLDWLASKVRFADDALAELPDDREAPSAQRYPEYLDWLGMCDYVVDDSLPPNTLRFEVGSGYIDFDVEWVDGEMRLSPRRIVAEVPREGSC